MNTFHCCNIFFQSKCNDQCISFAGYETSYGISEYFSNLARGVGSCGGIGHVLQFLVDGLMLMMISATG